MPMRVELQSLLSGFEAPAIFYRENTVRYFNEAAKTLFPQLKDGGPMPEGFDAVDSPFRAEATKTDKGILYLFRPKYEERSAGDLEIIIRQLRDAAGSLMIAGERLASHVTPNQESSALLSMMDRSLYAIRRLCDHTDLLRQLEGRQVGIYREAPLDLADLSYKVAEQTESLCCQAGISFSYESTLSSTLIRGNQELLARMLFNLLSNAIQAAGPGGRIGLKSEKRGDRICFTVWDNGQGMERERLATLFRPQRRQGLPQPRDDAGMGLRIVREIAVLHGGLVLAEAQNDRGTRMTVSLPIRPPQADSFCSTSAWDSPIDTLALVELSTVLPSSLYSMGDWEEARFTADF